MVRIQGIELKKSLGQHFLRDYAVTDAMLAMIEHIGQKSVLEIGPGNGFLTREILEKPIKKLWAFEIDQEWVQNLKNNIQDERFSVLHADFLGIDNAILKENGPWIVLANLPYNITFPILERFISLTDVIEEGVIMIQEEVAQKLVATQGRAYGFASIFFQYFFDFSLLLKIPPSAFTPPPNVFSRLLYFKPKKQEERLKIEHTDAFFKFVRLCFRQPRRTLKNNLIAAQIDTAKLDEQTLGLRAQQLSVQQLVNIFEKLNE